MFLQITVVNCRQFVILGEGFWFDLPIVKEVITMAKTIFPVVDYAVSYVGSFPGGHLGYVLCSTNPVCDICILFAKISTRI